ncbi:YdaU family protein [Acidovorax sp. LjRoot74]|uniref:YdaU family protein n=1 Tax=Acidovorax sp. LjRoot74 TaxID=3342337 RepID=UPI003ECD213B
MDKKTDAWMPLWIGAYLADTQRLTRDQHGGYLLLLMAYWREGGPLADDDEELAAIVKATPKEWAQLRPRMAKFFTVADGVWTQKRMQQELAGAKERSEKSSSKAQKAAQARWGQAAKNAPSIPPGNAPGNAPSIPQAVHEDCPTPSPSSLRSETPSIEGVARTREAEACIAMRQAGMQAVNPSSPKLRALLDAGITVAELVEATADAVAKGKPFAYALASAEGRRRDAATAPMPPARAATNQHKHAAAAATIYEGVWNAA